jgi:hypothetical protein
LRGDKAFLVASIVMPTFVSLIFGMWQRFPDSSAMLISNFHQAALSTILQTTHKGSSAGKALSSLL